ncbi:MAG: TIGR04219 family outer membrane beta-barrel protein [Pseudomonadales bacterium]|nr:TIGR04219 family outer membrane beta-barrel protein [Pseudomonadales bacterium]
MKRKTAFLLSLLLTQVCLASEKEVQLQFQVTAWAQKYAGDFKISAFDIRPIDVVSDLGYGSQTNRLISFGIVHNVSALPQFKIRDSSIDAKQTSLVPSDFTFGGLAFLFSLGDSIKSSIHFDHQDISLYYNIGKTKPFMSLGATLRKFDGRLTIEGIDGFLRGRELKSTFREWVPLIYGRVYNDLRVSNLSNTFELHYGRLQGNQMIDFSVMFEFDLKYNLGIDAGFRYLTLDIANFGGISTDITVSGPLLSMNYKVDI